MRTLALIVALLQLLAFPVAAQERPINFCFAKAERLVSPEETRPWTIDEHLALMEQHGIRCGGFFYNPLTADNLRVPYAVIRDRYFPLIEDGVIDSVFMTLVIDGDRETIGSSADLDTGAVGLLERVIAGEFDYGIVPLAERIASDGRPIYIQPLHEGNGWDKHGMCAEGNSQELYVQAFQHIVSIFREAGAVNVQFVMNWNRRGCDGVLGDADNYFAAIDELVVAHSVSSYNRCGTAARYDQEMSFASEFAPIYDRLVSLTDKPIWVAETSTSGQCGPRLPWFEEMLADLNTRFPRVEQVTFFFGDVKIGDASNDEPIQWGFGGDEEQIRQFRELIAGQEEAAVRVPEPRPTRVVVAEPAVPTSPVLTFPSSVAPATELTQVRDTFLGFDSAPWSVWARFSVPLYEEGNPALNTVTGHPFGETGPVFRFTATQRFLWDMGSYDHGPGVVVSGALSNNRNQWWNNQAAAGITYGLYGDLPFDSVDWGGWSVEAFAGRREYFAPTPSRLDNENVLELRFGINVGGDWFR